jgi:phage terminase Nu1 subunit (DNA packaging protein)
VDEAVEAVEDVEAAEAVGEAVGALPSTSRRRFPALPLRHQLQEALRRRHRHLRHPRHRCWLR